MWVRQAASQSPEITATFHADVFPLKPIHSVRHDMQPLERLPNPGSARPVLPKLTNGEAIFYVMNLNRFSVGLLAELTPHEYPGLLGLNVSRGQAIKLRIRTDRYNAFWIVLGAVRCQTTKTARAWCIVRLAIGTCERGGWQRWQDGLSARSVIADKVRGTP